MNTWKIRYGSPVVKIEQDSRRVSGVDAVALSDHLPLEGGSNYYAKLRGQTGAMSNQLVEKHSASVEYFRAMGISVVQGRDFASGDASGGLPVAMVNDELARAISRTRVRSANGSRLFRVNPARSSEWCVRCGKSAWTAACCRSCMCQRRRPSSPGR